MPLYTFYQKHGSVDATSVQEVFFKSLAALHAHTFGTDHEAVRVVYVVGYGDSHRYTYGGYGFQYPKGFLGVHKATDYIVAQIPFSGSADEWQDYCRKVVKLWGRPGLRTIYLQKVDFEFEIADDKTLGEVIRDKKAEALTENRHDNGEGSLPPYRS